MNNNSRALRRLCFLLIATLFHPISVYAQDYLFVTGFVEAKNKQSFSTPDSDSWQLQIKWLAAEGELVAAGDTVVVFESASVESEVEAEEAKLRKAEAESKKRLQELRLELIESKSSLEIARLELEKASLEASIPEAHLTKIVYEQNLLEQKKRTVDLQDAEKEFEQKQAELVNQEKTIKIEYLAALSELERKRKLLSGLSQKAERAGTVIYVRHPWNGRKIKAGDTVQKGFSVLEIPDVEKLYVKAWLNEVDIAKLKPGAVEFFVDALDNKKYQAKVRSISEQGESRPAWGDAYYHAVEVDVMASELDVNMLLPGMSVLLKAPVSETSLVAEGVVSTGDVSSGVGVKKKGIDEQSEELKNE